MRPLALFLLIACSDPEPEPAIPEATSNATDAAFGRWAMSLAEPIRGLALRDASEEERAALESDKALGVVVTLRWYLEDRGFVIRALALPDGRVRYFGTAGYAPEGDRPWPAQIIVPALREWHEYVRFRIEHADCAFEPPSAEDWTAGTADRAPMPRSRTSCAVQRELIRQGAGPSRSMEIAVHFESSTRTVVGVLGDEGVSFEPR